MTEEINEGIKPQGINRTSAKELVILKNNQTELSTSKKTQKELPLKTPGSSQTPNEKDISEEKFVV